MLTAPSVTQEIHVWKWWYSHEVREIGVRPRPSSRGARSMPEFPPRLARIVAIVRVSWKFLAVAVGCAVLVFGIVLGIRFIPYLPPPAGPFPVGTVLWDIDRSGADWFSPARGGCPVSVQLWYPAEPGGRRRTCAVPSVGRRFTLSCAVGSHRRDAGRCALARPHAVSRSSVTTRLGRLARR